MEASIAPEVPVVERRVIWIPLPMTNGGGIRSLLSYDDIDVVVEKKAGFYRFTATDQKGKVIFENSFYSDQRRYGWADPRAARDDAAVWLLGRQE